MSKETLYNKYRPQSLADVVEQYAIKTILSNQISNKEFKNVYLFVGSAGIGKTTIARIFAREINQNKGKPLEVDAATNNGVAFIEELCKEAYTQSFDSEFKVIILDECHALTQDAWSSMLKILEEPPKKTIFIFCTTNPEKIPTTILSRVQRYDFHRISTKGIRDRLEFICNREDIKYQIEALEYISKTADGGMRDAITLLDKCLGYSREIQIDNTLKILGKVDTRLLIRLTDYLFFKDCLAVIDTLTNLHYEGIDLKGFISQYLDFIIDVNKYSITNNLKYTKIPIMYKELLDDIPPSEYKYCVHLLDLLIKLKAELKWEHNPKMIIEATFLADCLGG